MAYIYDIADTWSGGGAFTGIKLNVTDSGSTAGSLLMDLQVGGVSRASVRKDGRLFGNSYYFDSLSGLILGASNQVMLALEGAGAFHSYKTGHYMVASNVTLRWSSDSSLSTTGLSATDVILARDAANTLAQRNGVNAQAFNLYNTYTDASNYERGFMRWSGNVLSIGAEALGTGTARVLALPTTVRVGLYDFTTLGSDRISSTFDWGYAVRLTSSATPLVLRDDAPLAWSDGATFSATRDLFLRRDAANTLAQRNGTAAQTSRLYGTYTDASNYRRLTKTMSTAGVAEIKPEGAGTGASGNVLHISGLPTSNPGPGILWNNLGAVVVGT